MIVHPSPSLSYPPSPLSFYHPLPSETLAEKKRQGKELAATVNSTKREIDDNRATLDEKRAKRVAEEGDLANDLYDEEEFELLSRLKKVALSYGIRPPYFSGRSLRDVPGVPPEVQGSPLRC